MFGSLSISRSSSLRTLVAFVAVILAVSALVGPRLAGAQDGDGPILPTSTPAPATTLTPNPNTP